MADLLARSARQRRGAILAIALASGGIAFTVAAGDDGPDVSPVSTPSPSVTSEASVLGVVVTQLPTAAPAAPAVVDEDDVEGDADTADDLSPTTTRRTSDTTDRPPASLVPPTFIENTTTTTDGTTPPTVDLTTTTTEAPTTTETPPG